MGSAFQRAALAFLALACGVTTGRAQTPTPGCSDIWIPTSTANAPIARYYHTAIWTGNEMIVWGGYDGNNNSFFDTGGRYNPGADSWIATSTTNAPSVRYRPTTVWTGSQMIVWGGGNNTGGFLNTGGRYNPTTDAWTATSTTNAPTPRIDHTAVWTGSEMIVWGGNDNGGLSNTGRRYNPNTGVWTATSTANAPTPRSLHTAIWTGSEMIVWGGFDPVIQSALDSGGRYNPATNTWTATSTTNAPAARYFHTTVWTGTEMIVWGGQDRHETYFSTGAKYNPGTDTWTATSTTNSPAPRVSHAAIWTGGEMIVWGGSDRTLRAALDSGGRYQPSTDSWTATSITNAPAARNVSKAVWTTSEMIVWGGSDGDSLNTGGRYCAQLPTATPIPTPTPTVNISGTISYCSNPVPGPVANVTLNLVGDTTASTLSDGFGNYQFASLPSGGSYTVTPSKAAWTPGSAGINTVDVIAVQRHFLILGPPITACPLTAADVNGFGGITTVDVIAIQRFFLALSTGIANVGKYNFSPASRTYPGIVTDQTGQDYDALVFGDVVTPFTE